MYIYHLLLRRWLCIYIYIYIDIYYICICIYIYIYIPHSGAFGPQSRGLRTISICLYIYVHIPPPLRWWLYIFIYICIFLLQELLGPSLADLFNYVSYLYVCIYINIYHLLCAADYIYIYIYIFLLIYIYIYLPFPCRLLRQRLHHAGGGPPRRGAGRLLRPRAAARPAGAPLL